MENQFNNWRNTKYKYLPFGDFYGNHPQTWEMPYDFPQIDWSKQDKNKKRINCNKLQNTFINISLAYFLPESTTFLLEYLRHINDTPDGLIWMF